MLTTRRGFLGILGATATTSYFFAPIGGWTSDLIINPNDLVRPQSAVSAGGGTVYYGKYHEQVWHGGDIKDVKYSNAHTANFSHIAEAVGPAIKFYGHHKKLSELPAGRMEEPLIYDGATHTARKMESYEIQHRLQAHADRMAGDRLRRETANKRFLEYIRSSQSV